MTTSISLSLSQFNQTFYKQIGRFERINQTTGLVDPELDKIVLTDDSEWMGSASLSVSDSVIGVFLPYSRYSALVPYMLKEDATNMVYSEIAYRSSSLQNASYYNLVNTLRDISTYTFGATPASYNFVTDPVSVSGDVQVYSRVPGEGGNTIAVTMSGAGTGAPFAISTSGVNVLSTYDETAITAYEMASAVNGSVGGTLIRAGYSGAGSSVFNPTGDNGTAVTLAVSGTAGTVVGNEPFAKAFIPLADNNDLQGVDLTLATAGVEGNKYVVRTVNPGAGVAESVSATGYTITVILGTDGSGNVTSTNQQVVRMVSGTLTSVYPYQRGATAIMAYAGYNSFSGGAHRPDSLAYKVIHVYKTKNDSSPSYVILGANQARELGLVEAY